MPADTDADAASDWKRQTRVLFCSFAVSGVYVGYPLDSLDCVRQNLLTNT